LTDWLDDFGNLFCVLHLQVHRTARFFVLFCSVLFCFVLFFPSGNRVTYTYFQNLGALLQGNP
ncbi:hypothetical protein ACQP3F_28755, partial [Escherichia coli]